MDPTTKPLGNYNVFVMLKMAIPAMLAAYFGAIGAGVNQYVAIACAIAAGSSAFGVDLYKFIDNNKVVCRTLKAMDKIDEVEKIVRSSIEQFEEARKVTKKGN